MAPYNFTNGDKLYTYSLHKRTIIVMYYVLNGVLRKRFTKAIIFLSLVALFVSALFGNRFGIGERHRPQKDSEEREDLNDVVNQTHLTIISTFINRRETWKTSNLGAWLFKYGAEVTPQNRSFTILVWKHLKVLTPRHIKRYSSKDHNPLESCSVRNCIFTGDDDQLPTADAVVVHLQRGNIPTLEHRDPMQRWIFLNDESPNHVFSLSRKPPAIENLANIFNWSMTYRSDADIPVPYGRTVALRKPILNRLDENALREIIPNWKKKRRNVLATILISNCGVPFRMHFLNTLQKYLPTDVYGGCSNNTVNKRRCPGHFKSDCQPISEYLFYLALENSNCNEYLTEKIWYHAYFKGAIPIILGPSLEDCNRLLPPNSFIHVNKEVTEDEVKDLAHYISNLSKNDELLLTLHQWRNHFEVLNEHGYFGSRSYHLCRVCEAMNYNDKSQKIYSEADMRRFLDPKLNCRNT